MRWKTHQLQSVRSEMVLISREYLFFISPIKLTLNQLLRAGSPGYKERINALHIYRDKTYFQ